MNEPEPHPRAEMPSGSPATLLLVEDDRSQAVLFERVLARTVGTCELIVHHASTVEEAWTILTADPDDVREDPPRAVVLDLSLPGPDGFALLRRIRDDARLKRTPVVVFSTAATDSELRRAFAGRANSFVVKPTDYSEYATLARQICTYWGQWNRPVSVA